MDVEDRRPGDWSSLMWPFRRTTTTAPLPPQPRPTFRPPPLPPSIHTPTSSIYLIYDPSAPPAHPGDGWTRFVCVSDTHGRRFGVPGGDVLLHAGDLTGVGRREEFEDVLAWVGGMGHPVKIIIAGNHDLPLHTSFYPSQHTRWTAHRARPEDPNAIHSLLRSAKESHGIVYLENESYRFKVREGGREWVVYGSPWTPEFHYWAFNYTAEEAEGIVSQYEPCDILMTHGPPYEILDLTLTLSQPGCATLLAHLPRLRPRLHLFGHIHESHSAEMRTVGSGKEGVEIAFVNAANMPMGPRGVDEGTGERVDVGGRGFQAVIVDLKDEVA